MGIPRGQHERRDSGHPLRRVNDYLPAATTRTRRWSRPERTYRLTYRRHPMATLASAIAAVAALVMLAATATVATTGMSGSVEKKGSAGGLLVGLEQRGARRRPDLPGAGLPGRRGAPDPRDGPPGRDPDGVPAVMQDGEWNTEWIIRASNGSARLVLDPWCRNGTWCDGTYDYRIKVGDAITKVTIQYWEQ